MLLDITRWGLLLINIFANFHSNSTIGKQNKNVSLAIGGKLSNSTVILPTNTSVASTKIKTPHQLELEAGFERRRHRGLAFKISESILFATIGGIGIFGNSLVILAIIQDPELQVQRQLSNMTVLSLAFADWGALLIVCMPCAITAFYQDYPFPDFVCLIVSICNLGFIIATIGCLTVISIERFIAVTWPLHYPQIVTFNRLLFFQGVIWFHAIWTPIVWALYGYTFNSDAGVCDFDWGGYEPDEWFPLALGIWCITYQSGCPGTLMIYCNISIVRTARGHGKATDKGHSKTNPEEEKANAKILKAMVICILTFWLMTMPLGAVRIAMIFGYPVPFWISRTSTYVQFLSSCVNPLIYGLFRKDFRDAYAKMWKNFKMSIGM